MTTIAIVDYGMGNFHSVARALKYAAPDADIRICNQPHEIDAADRVVFPGQGAMADCCLLYTSAFRGTLVRTYSGALTRVTSGTTITALPFRGDPKADDVVVRTLISQPNGQPVGVDYRLEKTPQGWKIYDMNVEGIWLIENYRNQFAQQINQNGIDGLIQALNQRNQ